ncbi:MAG: hypothetical protein UX04_C0002G0043 [Microgenomates group bacterium GW2011_GWF2_45_18]|nr:MAG: hypothetical protein UW18_C0001G0054 [Microgenomates group bacterium GW2011_GWF1_44_10]KKU01900.1 MAG: hypothetical protein UX04_C0002G0043 [Microgenomates group bacterium GW2011_GWF2_45_18]OGJ40249.1 MAG: hypothetical protein A2378_03460 [Candidatus Pacebacteria bacterium RIFOXYB1_FULL_44_10]HAU98783.1 hypothetical protein [Candidatus Paceibacterota bacterium]HAX01397.1 hypothetical protein [Candidatus Paceibacterota bacterium]
MQETTSKRDKNNREAVFLSRLRELAEEQTILSKTSPLPDWSAPLANWIEKRAYWLIPSIAFCFSMVIFLWKYPTFLEMGAHLR